MLTKTRTPTRPLAALAALAAAALLAPAAARAADVWTALASEKIRPDAAARQDRAAALSAAKNEFEAFQVVVTGPATRVSVTASELEGAGRIAPPVLAREELIDVVHPSAADGATGRFPDALLPDVDDVVGEKRNAFPFDVPAGESRAVWVELHVPPDAPAGDYRGTVTVHSDAGDTAVPVALTVWDFALPSTASLRSAFALTQTGLANVHGASGEALTELRQRYAQLALDHRVSISDVWDDGQGTGDWSHFDAAYGPFLDGTASTRLQGARLTSVRAGARLDSAPEHADWAGHFRQRGWFDRLFQYTCDEPPITCGWDDVPARAQVAKQADPEFRTLVTTDADQARQHGVDGAIDLVVPLVNALDDRGTEDYGWTAGGETAHEYVSFLQAPRKELWLYQSCMSHGCGGYVDIGNPSADQLYFTGWPSYVIDASAVRARAMEWFSFRYGGTGELYYETIQAYYGPDAWTDQWQFSGNGDGDLFYPGTAARIGGQTDIPVASIRLKMVREGMEDYEYLKLLSDLGAGDRAQAIAQRLFPHAWQADPKPADLMAARAELAKAILERSVKPASTTATAPTPATSGAPPEAAAGATPEAATGATPEAATGASGPGPVSVPGAGGGCASGGSAGLLALALAALAIRRRASPARARG